MDWKLHRVHCRANITYKPGCAIEVNVLPLIGHSQSIAESSGGDEHSHAQRLLIRQSRGCERHWLYQAIQKRLLTSGVFANVNCGWSNQQLWQWIGEMDLYENAHTLRYWSDGREAGVGVAWSVVLGHILPTSSLLHDLMAFVQPAQPCLSIGSGQGLIEYMLLNMGVEMVASDIEIWPWVFIQTHALDAQQACAKFPNARTLMLLWPNDTGYDEQALRDFKGERVILIACSPRRERKDIGSHALWSRLESEFEVVKRISLASCPSQLYEPTCYLAMRRPSSAHFDSETTS